MHAACTFVALGAVDLELDGATRLQGGSTRFGAKRGQVAGEAVAGELLVVEFPIRAPADLGERADRGGSGR